MQGLVAPEVAQQVAPPPAGSTGSTGSWLLRSQARTMLLWVRASTHLLERSPDAIDRAPLGRYVVTVPLSGSSTVWQEGRRARVVAGSFSVVDGDRPFRVEVEEPLEALVLVVPHADLDAWSVGSALVTGVALPTDRGVGAVMRAALLALASEAGPLGRDEDVVVLGHVVALVALAAAGARTDQPLRSADRFFRAAIDDIEQHLHRPDLTAADTAHRLGISVSYLTKLFTRRGTSYGRWVSSQRLDRAWAKLGETDGGARTVTRIAAECGFPDSAHFARVFRARFGVTPSRRRLDAAPVVAGVERRSGARRPRYDRA